MLSSSLQLSPWLLLGLFCVWLVNRYVRLRAFPGPTLAAVTDLWRAHAMHCTDWVQTLQDVHQRYGPFVRLGPNIISISDPEAVPTIYTMHGEFRKVCLRELRTVPADCEQADSYNSLRAVANGKVTGSVIDMQDEQQNSFLKRAVGSAFATKNLMDYEETLDTVIEMLVDVLQERGTASVFDTMQQFQADFLMRAAFSLDTEYLHTNKSTAQISGYPRVGHWGHWQALHSMEALRHKPPIIRHWMNRNSSPPLWTAMAMEELTKRQENLKSATGNVQRDLVTKYAEGGSNIGMDTTLLLKAVSSTISAGFDTTAFTMTTIFYLLLQNPEAMTKLMAELEGAHQLGKLSLPVKFHETHDLRYFSAVIKEAMRLYQFLIPLLEREVPSQGVEVCGQWVPGGTIVACPAPVIHRNQKLFGDDADKFRPDRWLEASESRRLEMERASLGFGSGKRICWGRHIAEMEMVKTVPRLLLEFNVSKVVTCHEVARSFC